MSNHEFKGLYKVFKESGSNWHSSSADLKLKIIMICFLLQAHVFSVS